MPKSKREVEEMEHNNAFKKRLDEINEKLKQLTRPIKKKEKRQNIVFEKKDFGNSAKKKEIVEDDVEGEIYNNRKKIKFMIEKKNKSKNSKIVLPKMISRKKKTKEKNNKLKTVNLDDIESRYNKKLHEISATISSVKLEADQEAEFLRSTLEHSLLKKSHAGRNQSDENCQN